MREENRFFETLNYAHARGELCAQGKESEEARRIKIFCKALGNKKGLGWVDSELKAHDLRPVYTRNPIEFILRHCFLCNECEGSYQKYGYEEFLELWHASGFSGSASAEPIKRYKNGTRSVITLRSLHEFIEGASLECKSSSLPETANFTADISSDADSDDLSDPRARSRFLSLCRRYSEQMSEVSYSVRFYFAKYIYFVICRQVLELRRLLCFFSESYASDIINDPGILPGADNKWSLVADLSDGMTGEDIKRSAQERDAKEETFKKALLGLVSNNLFLMGSSCGAENRFRLLPETSSLGNMKDLTAIFKSRDDTKAEHQRKHLECKIAAEKIRVGDFYDYPIHFSVLFDKLFEPAVSLMNEGDRIGSERFGRKYICGILDGEYDMSRSAVMMFLASAKGLLLEPELLSESDGLEFSEELILDCDRVNYMLRRMGYIDVGDADGALEMTYCDLFSSEDADYGDCYEELLQAMSDFEAEHGYSPIPFETERISALKKRKKMISDGKK